MGVYSKKSDDRGEELYWSVFLDEVHRLRIRLKFNNKVSGNALCSIEWKFITWNDTRKKNEYIGRKMMEISLKLEARFKINNKISAIPYGLR